MNKKSSESKTPIDESKFDWTGDDFGRKITALGEQYKVNNVVC